MYFVTVSREVTKTWGQWQSMESVAAEVPSAALRTERTSSGISKEAAGLILFPQAQLSPWPACSLPQINTKRMSAFKRLRHTSRTLPAPLIQVRAWLALTPPLCPALRVRHVGPCSSKRKTTVGLSWCSIPQPPAPYPTAAPTGQNVQAEARTLVWPLSG